MSSPSTFDRFTGSPAIRRLIRWCITLLVVGLVLWFAGGTVRQGWQQLSTSDIDISWPWVALSAGLYIVGLAPMAFYWRLALGSLGERPPLLAVVRGYYLGHLGKYVPGKAMVAVLRTGALVQSGCRPRSTVVSVFLETLSFMATGGMLAALLLVASGDAPAQYAWLSAGLALLVGLPITPPIARKLAGRVLAKQQAEGDQPTSSLLAGITWRLTAAGVACSTIAWTLLGLSLWAAVRSVGTTGAGPFAQLALWIEAVTLPVVAGFLSLIPGGAFVRDFLQVELLAPALPEGTSALLAAGLWRLISVSSEGAICGILEASRLCRRQRPTSDDTT
ncbi:flippase-like domain-containing protein [Aeoliella sp. ICT_H6.2]|uniref:Flippase-like domain-containing protein n=1 Tax=Aeoliella straminimaris TaxID=2954799 RepID=A0A9X2FHW8_9BACT|nr:lysylphosphatidylglycerol synthase transmembrane domain-containing protein [Aeoliella straminimaris]MCO6046566.1 flippase-like domain-containing protein [Aeoliella straminimaris]